MIKFTVNPENECTIYKFDKFKIMIGKKGAKGVDIPLNDPRIQPRHVSIEEQNNCFIVKNLANDPFTSINGMPFGKKSLKNFDQIEIDQNKIIFEFIEEEEEKPEKRQPEQNPFSDHLQNENINIDNLLKEVEQLSNACASASAGKKASTPPSSSENKEPEDLDQTEESESFKQRTSYYLQDFDDESEQWTDDPYEDEPHKTEFAANMADKWKLLAGLFVAILSLSGVIFFGVYFSASEKNSQEEKKIAAGIADIAMAMTHARLNHITPNKQNWSDPSFIRNNLSRVLPPNLHTQAQIDSEGRFVHYPYRLRIYTSRNMEQFVIIAQPDPNLMQWLVHKKTILIDSESMQMHKVTELKALNRLLANPDPLEGSNGEEIRRLINEGRLMSLNSLSGHKNHWGFSPPKALGFIRPGAENYIYNAPRYYPFGEELLSKAVHIYETPSSPGDVSLIQSKMEDISKFIDIVLFTSEGLQTAINAQHAMQTFAPNSKFLVAYVKFNPKGFLASSHLLINEENEKIAFLRPPMRDFSPIIDKNTPNFNEDDFFNLQINDVFADGGKLKHTENKHPLFLVLDAVYTNRKNALISISRQMLDVLKQHNNEFIQNFNETFFDLLQLYVNADKHHQHKIAEELAKLYEEYSEMPLEEFLEHVEQAKLTSFANFILEKKKNNPDSKLMSHHEILEALQTITEAKTLEELSLSAESSAKILSLEKLPDPEKLMYYQEIMHRKTLKKLSEFLLSPQSPYAFDPLQEYHRESLDKILEYAWIRNPYEAEYFQQEFNHLVETQLDGL